jgi:integrase/recombinase XerD
MFATTFATKMDTSRKLKDGSHPIVLQVIFDKKVRRIRLHLRGKITQWDRDSGLFKQKVHGGKRKNAELKEAVEKAESIYYSEFRKKPFNFKEFASLFREEKVDKTIFQFFDEVVQDLKDKGRAGYAMYFKDIKKVILNHTGTEEVFFTDLDYNWCERFETACLKRGCSGGGTSAYFRCIKALYNRAIKKGLVDQKYYPFQSPVNRRGYSFAHLKSKKNPRALSQEDMQKLKDYIPTEYQQRAYQLFMFSYYAFGANFTDIAHLKKQNVQGDYLVYTRRKTGSTIIVPLRDETLKIIESFHSDTTDYLFPILNAYHGTDQTKIKNRIKKVLKKINTRLKEIAYELELSNRQLTFYVARHSAATISKKLGASVEEISDLLGHQDTKITQTYLARFAGTELNKAVGLL